jgi:hypothetical protein
VHLILLCFAVGGACRARVIMKLSKLYSSPTDAERNLQVTAGKISKSLFPEAAPELAQFSPISIQTIINPGVNSSICSDISIECQDPLFEQILKLTLSEQFDLVGDVVHLIAEKVYGIDIPPDFVRMSLEEHAIKKPSNALESENNFTCISDDDGVNGSDDISSSECLTERSCNSSDAEEDKTITGTTCQQKVHTVIFKVIGCTKEQGYQEALRKARDSMQSGVDVPVPEPSNPFNTNAVAFMCFIDNKWHRIGYVVNEILHHIHEAINNNLIISVKFAWIKFISDWMHSGPGYFAGVALTKYGEWPKIVVSKRSTR